MSSRRIKISRPAITSFFNVEESTIASKTIAGRRFAKRSISFRRRSKPLSGFSSNGKSSYFGPPTDPNKTASALTASARVSSVNGVPCASYAAPPTNPSCRSNDKDRLAPSQSTTLRTCPTTSGPIPSPGSTSNFLFDAISVSLKSIRVFQQLSVAQFKSKAFLLHVSFQNHQY